MQPRKLALLAAIVVSLAAPGSALAERGAVVVFGKSKAHHLNLAKDAIVEMVSQSGWLVLEAPFNAKELEEINTCLSRDRPWPCIAATAHSKQVERMVVVQVEPDPHGKGITITEQVLLPGEGVPSLQRRFCSPCEDADLTNTAKELTELLLELAVARQGNTAIEVLSKPSGAVIQIDGTMVGNTDASIKTSAGVHTVILQLSGYQPVERTITVVEGHTEKIEVELTPATPVAVVVPPKIVDKGSVDAGGNPPHRSYVLPLVVTGVGAVAVIAGVTAQAMTSHPNTFEQPSRLYNDPAIGTAIAGGVLVGVGVYLLLRHPHADSTPTAALIPGGGTIGWSRSF